MDETAFADWSYPGRGLIRGEALAKFVRDKTNRRDIEQMRIPLGIAATDLDSGEGILFRRGDTGTAVRANLSTAVSSTRLLSTFWAGSSATLRLATGMRAIKSESSVGGMLNPR